MIIPFNKPYLTGNETLYIADAVGAGKISGNGQYTQRCQAFFEARYGFNKCLLTTSCTDALEMCALLLHIQPGDEVIMPSFTFVSTANAFVLRGAHIVFADSRSDYPGMDVSLVERLITPKTKAIVVVHYAGVACDMEGLLDLCHTHGLFLVEDAAQAVESFYFSKDGSKKALGSIGHLAAFSFHETKNITSGEGGMLVVNDPVFEARAEVLWEKGTNRSAYFRREVDKYGWVDVGSSFLPSEITASFLWAQLEHLSDIQQKRTHIWNTYLQGLQDWAERHQIQLPFIPAYATNNAHIFYVVCNTAQQRTALIQKLKERGILAVFHYQSLHTSTYYRDKHDGRSLPQSDWYSECLVRLPLYFELSDAQLAYICHALTHD